MKDHVVQYLNDKKAKSGDPGTYAGQSLEASASNKMGRIMELIYANSLFASIH